MNIVLTLIVGAVVRLNFYVIGAQDSVIKIGILSGGRDRFWQVGRGR